MGVQRGAGEIELVQSGADRPAVGEVDRQRPARQRSPARETVALTDAHGGAQGAHRTRVAELVASEAEGVQRCNLGFGLAPPARQAKRPRGQLGGPLRVGFDERVRGLRQREWFPIRIDARHTEYVSGRSPGALIAHRI